MIMIQGMISKTIYMCWFEFLDNRIWDLFAMHPVNFGLTYDLAACFHVRREKHIPSMMWNIPLLNLEFLSVSDDSLCIACCLCCVCEAWIVHESTCRLSRIEFLDIIFHNKSKGTQALPPTEDVLILVMLTLIIFEPEKHDLYISISCWTQENQHFNTCDLNFYTNHQPHHPAYHMQFHLDLSKVSAKYRGRGR